MRDPDELEDGLEQGHFDQIESFARRRRPRPKTDMDMDDCDSELVEEPDLPA